MVSHYLVIFYNRGHFFFPAPPAHWLRGTQSRHFPTTGPPQPRLPLFEVCGIKLPLTRPISAFHDVLLTSTMMWMATQSIAFLSKLPALFFSGLILSQTLVSWHLHSKPPTDASTGHHRAEVASSQAVSSGATLSTKTCHLSHFHPVKEQIFIPLPVSSLGASQLPPLRILLRPGCG